ncbi:MAG: glycoside hydrolase family 3 C-terminal domain-containing protein, partial [Vallitaleaceae bacterium]|nr:glycoside hydrolase family 3 C-terminal domain-containing protein [Vallitaleaceae bacterium]
ELSMEVLDENVRRVLTIVDRHFSNRNMEAVFDRDADHEKARKIATESMVLLKNDGILPLSKSKKLAFIGEFAKNPRFQGGGSSHINCHKVSNAVDSALACGYEVSYAKGYDLIKDQVDAGLIEEACQAAKAAEIAVLFVGLPDAYESEGYDRKHMSLPDSHNELIHAVATVQKNLVIVLHNGSPVEMPWIGEAKAVLEAYLAGQAVGAAVVDVLFGDVNPSGKLAESFPIRLEDNPSYLFYVGEKDTVEYREGVFVGYRYYDKKKMDVLFPFGHGLSYTSFEYSNLKVDRSSMKDHEELTLSVDITNTGDVFGKEVVQVYVNPSDRGIAIRPVRELKAYEKVALAPKETKTLQFTLSKRAFAYYHVGINDWYVESGNYGIEVGASSRDIRLKGQVEVLTTTEIPTIYHLNCTIGDLLSDPKASQAIAPFVKSMEAVFGNVEESEGGASSGAITDEMKMAMIQDLPIRNLVSFSQGQVSEEMLLQMLNSIK